MKKWSVGGRTTYEQSTNHLHACTNHQPTTNRPPTDHLPTTYRPLSNHLPADHLPTTYQPFTNHLPTTYQPLANHLATTYRPHTDHFLHSQNILVFVPTSTTLICFNNINVSSALFFDQRLFTHWFRNGDKY